MGLKKELGGGCLKDRSLRNRKDEGLEDKRQRFEKYES